jgi:4'-phosphopantetheinyl transferase
MTSLYYYLINDPLSLPLFMEKLSLLPADQQEKIKKFRRWQDAHASLFGKLLLKQGLQDFGIAINLNEIKYNAYGKPYFENDLVGFNITHSGNFVGCIISNDTTTIGIDAEVIKELDIEDFQDLWCVNEWADIQNNDLNVFYKYWTSKEAVVKAIGKGLSISLNEINVDNDVAKIGNETYFITNVDMFPHVIINVASKQQIGDILIYGFNIQETLTEPGIT